MKTIQNWAYKSLDERYDEILEFLETKNVFDDIIKYEKDIRKRALSYCKIKNYRGHLKKVVKIATESSNEDLLIDLLDACTINTFVHIMK